jgi:uncharacterized protein (DUF362 family)
MTNIRVGIVETNNKFYPSIVPFNPSFKYPEYPFGENISSIHNAVYDGIRSLFILLNMDTSNLDTPEWNPLGAIIKPGMSVVLKPNFVIDQHTDKKDIFSIITHPSVIRAITDYCWIALKGKGSIIIADAPQTDCNFENLLKITEIDQVCKFYLPFGEPKIEYRDLRSYCYREKFYPSTISYLDSDPEGSRIVNLGMNSSLISHPHPELFYGAGYDRKECIKHHIGERQEYEISNTILNADVVISIPKLKVHKKVGVTLNIKGLVGICANKNLCLHYTLGPPSQGGDQYPDNLFSTNDLVLIKMERLLYDLLLAKHNIIGEYILRAITRINDLNKIYLKDESKKNNLIKAFSMKRTLDSGNWYGNDSAWRMSVDLLKIICFADKKGEIQNTPQRRFFSIIDGVIGGENNGPLVPDPKPVGIIIGGDNLVAVDLVATRLMGFDYNKIKLFSIIKDPRFKFKEDPFESIEMYSNRHSGIISSKDLTGYIPKFIPHPGWSGHIEI